MPPVPRPCKPSRRSDAGHADTACRYLLSSSNRRSRSPSCNRKPRSSGSRRVPSRPLLASEGGGNLGEALTPPAPFLVLDVIVVERAVAHLIQQPANVSLIHPHGRAHAGEGGDFFDNHADNGPPLRPVVVV